MRNKIEGKCCGTCAYVEQDDLKAKEAKIYCSNCESERCSEWVEEEDSCPLWVKWTKTTKYYNLAVKIF